MPATGYFQPCAQVNYPDANDQSPIRSLEWKYLMPAQEQLKVKGTVVTREFPFSPDNPDQFEYPLPEAKSQRLFEDYRHRALRNSRLFICGRLGEYRYLDMDQAIGRALLISRQVMARHQEASVRRPRSPIGTPEPSASLAAV